MRGIAAIWVMLAHAGFYANRPILQNSYVAVDLFFILSGFVLAYAYGMRPMRLGQFMARRFLRLYPMFLAGLILGGMVLVAATEQGISTLTTKAAVAGTLLNAFYVPFLNQGLYYHGPGEALAGEIFAANPPYWSLFFEIAVNLFFLNLVGLKQKTLAIMSGLFLVLIFVSALLSGLISGKGGFNLEGGWNSLELIGGFPRVFYGFTLGLLIFKLAGQPWSAAVVAKARRMPGMVVLVMAATMLLLSLPRLPHLGAVYYFFAVALAAPALVFLGSALHCRSRFGLGLVRFLGWLSYPLYCVHYPVIRAVNLLGPEYKLPGIAGMAISCGLSIVLAATLAAIYDRPVRDWLRRFLEKPADAVVLTTPTLAE
jgi:peptidoglycan/LPS O-acetylase OafA/YrhL